MDRIETIVIKAIVELLEIGDRETVTRETRLQDLGIDSALMLELFLMVEDNVPDVEIDPAKLRPEHFSTVESLTAFVASTSQEEAA
ncbi:acyl carrier protein [Agrobacterium rosae]|uniref:Phosphopantetheine-binding protein n=1 Tax=Agrobacterium rosae TaxID=1972867 RepID=A0AAW9FJ91_9HYPH|nr:phosphopantetheine-binding protein [Agrobacterium rosae]MDX8305550.1 phosphopantetheine-binding protein [Agrobacterium rosae]